MRSSLVQLGYIIYYVLGMYWVRVVQRWHEPHTVSIQNVSFVSYLRSKFISRKQLDCSRLLSMSGHTAIICNI